MAMLALAGCAHTIADVTFADGSRLRLNSTRLFTTSGFSIDPKTHSMSVNTDADTPELPKQVSLLNANLATLLGYLQGLINKEPEK